MKRLVLAAAVSAAAIGLSAAPAHASSSGSGQDCYPSCAGTTGNNLGGGPSGPSVSPVPTGSLAFTGIDVAGTAGAGVLLVVGGTVLVRVSRRRVTS